MPYRIIRQLFRNGRYIFQTIYNNKQNVKILDIVPKPRDAFTAIEKRSLQPALGNFEGLRHVGCQIGLQARKLFVDNVLNRVTNSLSSDLRRKATKRLFYGDSRPFFALVGVSLASGSGLLTKDDELEGVCWEIREAVSKLRWNYSDQYTLPKDDINLQDLIIGPPIAKGCSAVVYSAKYKTPLNTQPETSQDTPSEPHDVSMTSSISEVGSDANSQTLSPFRDMRFLRCRNDSFRNSVPNINFHTYRRNSVDILVDDDNDESNKRSNASQDSISMDNTEESFEVLRSPPNERVYAVDDMGSLCDYPIAVKMMFNYDIQSCATAIFKAMQREILPARKKCPELEGGWEQSTLPPHPNIVLMYSVFADRIPNGLPLAGTLFPSALPQRINSDGYGRNMSLFLLMKRYDCSLHEYLSNNNISMRTSIILFAQLLEAIAHLSAHGIAHRDLKSDNILLEMSDDETVPPSLVLSDFGCCLADPKRGFLLPYNSNEIDKGGNIALMAPEVITQTPSSFSVINYSKADLWSCGTIAYEIFGFKNPFYNKEASVEKRLRNVNYRDEDLPALDNNSIPEIVRALVENILKRNPSERLSPSNAATVMQLFLWAPSNWLKGKAIPNSTEILQWLLCLTTKILCEARIGQNSPSTTAKIPKRNSDDFANQNNYANNRQSTGRRTLPEYILIASFLSRAKLHEIKRSLEWIHNV